MANIPCITTVQGLGAAVQGIEAIDPGRRSACGRSRTGSDEASRPRDGVLAPLRPRLHPDRPGEGAPRSASARSGPPGRCWRRRRTPGDAGHGDGADLPQRARAGRRLRQERRRHRRAGGAGLRPRRGRHGHRRGAARQPEAAAVPADRGPRGRQPDGLQQRRRRGRRRAARPRAAAASPTGPVARRQHRQDQGRARGRRGAVAATTRSRARLLAPYADYLVVNVCSPNTPGPAQPAGRREARAAARAVRACRRTWSPTAGCRCW